MLGVAVSSLQTCKSRYQDIKQNILGKKINLKYQFKIFSQSRQCFPLTIIFFTHLFFSPGLPFTNTVLSESRFSINWNPCA